MAAIKTITGDCLTELEQFPQGKFDLIYLDPPFFTQKQHKLAERSGGAVFQFQDLWESHQHYAVFLQERLVKLHASLKDTGVLFFHCDRNASHIIRLLLDQTFGSEMFQSEIIWSYKRWSNSAKGLLPAHQTIFFYAKTDAFKFNTKRMNYSVSTNIDQITQKRCRDGRNKAIYVKDERGEVVSSGGKKGVPLSDVWEIPYLNPKAKERIGYPTQKPILLLERLLELCTDEGDWVLDPFCGSGTTLVASQLLGRNAVGIDTSEEAIAVTRQRLAQPVKTQSKLLQRGVEDYTRSDKEVFQHLKGLEYFVVQRNKGIDAILKTEMEGDIPVFLRIQREGETVSDAAWALKRAAESKGAVKLIVIVVDERELFPENSVPGVCLVRSTALSVKNALEGK